MALIELTTRINAPIERCFDLSRDIGLHLRSTAHTHERVVAGRESGLCEAGDWVTWEAIHLGIKQRLTVEITKVEFPKYFQDRMHKGAFVSMVHDHYFEFFPPYTVMRDRFDYTVPFGWLGRFFDQWYLKAYMTRLLILRNEHIKKEAEAN